MGNKAYLINAQNKSITEVDVKDWREIAPLIGCDLFTVATTFPNGDTVYVDDEGLLVSPEYFFSVKGYPQPLAGNGLVLGSNEEGESKDVEMPLETLKGLVKFHTIQELRAKF